METLLYERGGKLIGLVQPVLTTGNVIGVAWGWCMPKYLPIIPGTAGPRAVGRDG